ncbi:NAD(P)H-dependent oxidoreductase [Pullulanibacillus sp. KACC 23026]|uniref:NAD(P)H-dependent oxidoreductase n=1 Tax=Pullulanibacillus sp. KACC 23026 TaxID=3028315 RepID=UPI0023B19D90|nr:NAD(P)H-dependent oxidoreductase [Pullulanibacillus sp. KACC 23026]WEG12430.1 NAD(P)H-dependent oxidoreductase [Pullulanibacillus sp. KACC 23026]
MKLTNSHANKDLLLKAFNFRHACKEFDPERKIPDEDFDLILEAARLSPSSVGLEPWRFVIIQNQEIRERLKNVSWGAQGQAPTASHFMVVLARTMTDLKYDSDYVSHMMREVHQIPEEIVQLLIDKNYKNFAESDFKLMESDRAMFDWACKQAYIALSNMMTTAAIMGIDSCPIEGFDRDKVTQVLKEEGILDEKHFGVACFAAFGYRVREPRPKSRQNLKDIVEWVK